MLSAKSIQRLYKPSRLQKFPVINKLHLFKSDQGASDSAANDTNLNLSRDQVIEIYDWISQLNSESNNV